MIKLGCFLTATCCINCDWFESPDVPFHRHVCPECGGDLEGCAGQFEIKETKSFWGTVKTEIIGFKRQTQIEVGSDVLLYDRYRFTPIPQKAKVIRILADNTTGVEIEFTERTNNPVKYPIASTTIVCIEQLRLDESKK